MADEKRRKNSTRWWKRSLSNRCSRVLGACTTCYRRARIRFKTIRCGWGCLPLPLSAVLQPGTGERGREFSVASAKPHHHVPRLRAFQEFKNSRSRGVSLTANGKPFFFLFCSRNLHRHIFPPSPLLRYRLSESCISSEERLIILIAFLRISYHIRLTKCNRIIWRIVHGNIGFDLSTVNFDFVHISFVYNASRFFPSLSFRLFRARSTIDSFDLVSIRSARLEMRFRSPLGCATIRFEANAFSTKLWIPSFVCSISIRKSTTRPRFCSSNRSPMIIATIILRLGFLLN